MTAEAQPHINLVLPVGLLLEAKKIINGEYHDLYIVKEEGGVVKAVCSHAGIDHRSESSHHKSATWWIDDDSKSGIQYVLEVTEADIVELLEDFDDEEKAKMGLEEILDTFFSAITFDRMTDKLTLRKTNARIEREKLQKYKEEALKAEKAIEEKEKKEKEERLAKQKARKHADKKREQREARIYLTSQVQYSRDLIQKEVRDKLQKEINTHMNSSVVGGEISAQDGIKEKKQNAAVNQAIIFSEENCKVDGGQTDKETVLEWLTAYKMEKFYVHFEDEGFDDKFGDVATEYMTDQEGFEDKLKAWGFKSGHLKKFNRMIKDFGKTDHKSENKLSTNDGSIEKTLNQKQNSLNPPGHDQESLSSKKPHAESTKTKVPANEKPESASYKSNINEKNLSTNDGSIEKILNQKQNCVNPASYDQDSLSSRKPHAESTKTKVPANEKPENESYKSNRVMSSFDKQGPRLTQAKIGEPLKNKISKRQQKKGGQPSNSGNGDAAQKLVKLRFDDEPIFEEYRIISKIKYKISVQTSPTHVRFIGIDGQKKKVQSDFSVDAISQAMQLDYSHSEDKGTFLAVLLSECVEIELVKAIIENGRMGKQRSFTLKKKSKKIAPSSTAPRPEDEKRAKLKQYKRPRLQSIEKDAPFETSLEVSGREWVLKMWVEDKANLVVEAVDKKRPGLILKKISSIVRVLQKLPLTKQYYASEIELFNNVLALVVIRNGVLDFEKPKAKKTKRKQLKTECHDTKMKTVDEFDAMANPTGEEDRKGGTNTTENAKEKFKNNMQVQQSNEPVKTEGETTKQKHNRKEINLGCLEKEKSSVKFEESVNSEKSHTNSKFDDFPTLDDEEYVDDDVADLHININQWHSQTTSQTSTSNNRHIFSDNEDPVPIFPLYVKRSGRIQVPISMKEVIGDTAVNLKAASLKVSKDHILIDRSQPLAPIVSPLKAKLEREPLILKRVRALLREKRDCRYLMLQEQITKDYGATEFSKCKTQIQNIFSEWQARPRSPRGIHTLAVLEKRLISSLGNEFELAVRVDKWGSPSMINKNRRPGYQSIVKTSPTVMEKRKSRNLSHAKFHPSTRGSNSPNKTNIRQSRATSLSSMGLTYRLPAHALGHDRELH